MGTHSLDQFNELCTLLPKFIDEASLVIKYLTVLENNKKYTEALAIISTAFYINPKLLENPTIIFISARINATLSLTRCCIQNLECAKTINPDFNNDDYFAWVQASSLRGLGKYQEALDEYERAKTLNPDLNSHGPFLWECAQTLNGLDKYQEAFAEFERVKYLSPELSNNALFLQERNRALQNTSFSQASLNLLYLCLRLQQSKKVKKEKPRLICC